MTWPVKKLSDICSNIFAGGDVPKDRLSKFKTNEFSIPVFANGEKNKGLYGFTDIARVVEPSITVSARGTIGYSEIRDEPFLPVVRLIVLTPNHDVVDLHYLKYVIKSMDFINSGSSIPQLTVPMIKNYCCGIPTIPEQKRIVAILDQAFADIEQARAKTEQNLKNARELFESYLQQVFSQRGEGWKTSKLKLITSKIGSGATPRGGKASYKDEGIPLVRSMNVHDRYFKEKGMAFIDEQQAEKLSNVIVECGDVLLNITGASVARCCIAPDRVLPARVNQHVSIIRVDQKELSPNFLNFILTSKFYKDQLLGIGEAGSTRQAITKTQIEEFKVDYPSSLQEQTKLLESLHLLEDQAKSVQKIYTDKLLVLDELKQSILQKAFTGELTKTKRKGVAA
ncbi:MAG: restriction endonuclease subunit S [Cycloclasticus sp.]|nr:restriction endonuclease subunit S [Cycloclasticus sp.]